MVEWYNGIRIKLKGYFIQMALKLRYKGYRITILLDTVIYIGIFLIGRALKWFKFYLMEF